MSGVIAASVCDIRLQQLPWGLQRVTRYENFMRKFRGPMFWKDSQKDDKVLEEPQGFRGPNIASPLMIQNGAVEKYFATGYEEDNFYETSLLQTKSKAWKKCGRFLKTTNKQTKNNNKNTRRIKFCQLRWKKSSPGCSGASRKIKWPMGNLFGLLFVNVKADICMCKLITSFTWQGQTVSQHLLC